MGSVAAGGFFRGPLAVGGDIGRGSPPPGNTLPQRLEFGAGEPAGLALGQPVVRDISIRGVKCEGARDAAMIRGLGESPVSGVTIKDAKLRA